MKQLDAWLDERLRVVNAAVDDVESVIAETKRAIKEKILESYRNGQGSRQGESQGFVSGMVKSFAREAKQQLTAPTRRSRKYWHSSQPRR